MFEGSGSKIHSYYLLSAFGAREISNMENLDPLRWIVEIKRIGSLFPLSIVLGLAFQLLL